jgi:AraC-like DNA-binding protein
VDILVENFDPNDLGPHHHVQWQILLVPPGAAQEVSWQPPGGMKQVRRLVGGDVWILPPEWIHTARWSEPTEIISLYVDDGRMKRYFPGIARDTCSVTKFSEHAAAAPEITDLCREVRQFANPATDLNDWRIASAGSHLATTLLHAHLKLSDGVFRPPSGLVDRIKDKLQHHLAAHRNERLRLGEIARSVGISDRHLRRVFKQETGVAPQEWVMIRKAAVAVRSLQEGNSIKATVDHAGFTSESHMHRLIFRIYGVTPTAFRKQSRAIPLPGRA